MIKAASPVRLTQNLLYDICPMPRYDSDVELAAEVEGGSVAGPLDGGELGEGDDDLGADGVVEVGGGRPCCPGWRRHCGPCAVGR
jgi:hypothetical protein